MIHLPVESSVISCRVARFDGKDSAQNESMLARIAAKSRADGECLIWTGACNGSGYGSITVGGRRGYKELVHRIAWIARYGVPPPETPLVLHHCDNPPCWRDGHLFLGTYADNMADMVSKGRGKKWQWRCENGPGAKLKNAQVVDIKRRLTEGQTQQSIADIYGVSKVAIGHIWRGRNFVEIPWPEGKHGKVCV